MDKARSILAALLAVWLMCSAIMTCLQLGADRIPSRAASRIEKKRVTVGAILIWITCFAVILAALLGELGLWAAALAIYGSYFFPMLIIRVHVTSPLDRQLIRGWLAMPFVVLLIILVLGRL